MSNDQLLGRDPNRCRITGSRKQQKTAESSSNSSVRVCLATAVQCCNLGDTKAQFDLRKTPYDKLRQQLVVHAKSVKSEEAMIVLRRPSMGTKKHNGPWR